MKTDENKKEKLRQKAVLEIEGGVFFVEGGWHNMIEEKPKRKKKITTKQKGLVSFTDIAKTLGMDIPSTIRTYRRAMNKIETKLRELIAEGVI